MPDEKDKIQIIVNGRKKTVSTLELSYEQVVVLAFDPPPSGPNIEITVSFRNGAGRPPEGTLSPGKSVKIHSGTIFVVKSTDKS